MKRSLGLLGFLLSACATPAARPPPALAVTAEAPSVVAQAAKPVTETPDAPFRASRPAAEPPVQPKAPIVVRTTLSNGIPLLVVERHDLPIVYTEVVVAGGCGPESVDTYAACKSLTSLLEKGTTTRSATEVSRAFQAIGAQHGVTAGIEAVNAHMQVLRSQLDSGLALLADVVLHPALSDVEVAAEQARSLDALPQARQDAEELEWAGIAKALYGRGHPYGHPPIATPQQIRAGTPAVLRAVYARVFARQHAALVVVGDVDPATIHAKMEKLFGAWPRGGEVPLRAPKVSPMTGPRVVLIDRPGTTQSLVYLSEPGVAWSDPRRDAFRLVNLVLGGFWMSRLNADLREKAGMSYWVNAEASTRRGAGPFRAGGAIVIEQTGPAILALLRDVRAMTQSEVSEEELAGAKQFATRGTYAWFETDEGMANALAGLVSTDRKLDEYTTLPARLAALTAKDLLDAARHYLHPDTMRIVVTADRAKVDPQLRALGLGDVEIRDYQGDVVPK